MDDWIGRKLVRWVIVRWVGRWFFGRVDNLVVGWLGGWFVGWVDGLLGG